MGWQPQTLAGITGSTDLDGSCPVRLVMAHDPSYGAPGGIAPGTVLWEVNPNDNGSYESPDFSILLNRCYAGDPMYLDLTAGPQTPEPGSALALIVGTVGWWLIRGRLRRKALPAAN